MKLELNPSHSDERHMYYHCATSTPTHFKNFCPSILSFIIVVQQKITAIELMGEQSKNKREQNNKKIIHERVKIAT